MAKKKTSRDSQTGKNPPASSKAEPKASKVKKPARSAGTRPAAAAPRRRASQTHPQEPTVKVSADTPLNVQGGALSEDELCKVKSGLTKKDLEHFRTLLLEKRAEIIGDVTSLEGDTLADAGNLSNMPLHMADVGSDNYAQEFSLGLAESERKLLREIDEALIRIRKGYYGVCLQRGVPIGKPRLDAKPWAKYCIEAVRELEKQGRSV